MVNLLVKGECKFHVFRLLLVYVRNNNNLGQYTEETVDWTVDTLHMIINFVLHFASDPLDVST